MLSNSFLPVEQDRVGPPVKDGVNFWIAPPVELSFGSRVRSALLEGINSWGAFLVKGYNLNPL